ncbi:MAG TPA: DNA-3-methyladenine glycosylase 2 family protein [Thermoplasmata archaeon]|nr:DNA-3-methyladenine glycosylase 2 family protein [Thermoplasmata archaeon]
MLGGSEPSPEEIARYLSRSDPVLAGLIRQGGPAGPPSHGAGFATLARAIIYQQISGAAGAAIVRRLRTAHGRAGFPTPGWFLTTPPATLRAAGVSPQKARYLRDLSGRVADGRLDLRRLAREADAGVIAALMEVHGIGRWTAQMYLMFSLHRPDVFPAGDLGVRKAVAKAWGLRTVPSERAVARRAVRWAPYRSHAAFYLWRSLGTASPG